MPSVTYSYAAANREFLESAEMHSLSDPMTLGAKPEERELRSRLLEAFRLGITSGERIAADRIAKLVRGDYSQ